MVRTVRIPLWAPVANSLLLVCWSASLGISICHGQDRENPSASDQPAAESIDNAAELSAIREASDAFVAAFNAGDAEAVAAHWTAKGELIDEAGQKYIGREAIAEEYAALLKAMPKAKMRIVIDSLKLLSDSAAIEEGRAMLDPAPAGAPAISKYLVVHVKENGKWLMSTVRDSRLEMPSAYRNVADLEWLIGSWTAEEHGAKSAFECRWIANKSFVERKYTLTQADGTTSGGLQLIGWNPDGGHIQSWNFSADGGHAVGVWRPIDGGWQSETRGVTGDGLPTSATNILRRLDDNAYVWQSTSRTLAGQSLPDTDEVVLKRPSDQR
jgi:uncharacterized protein (TIGR02246 family)